MCQFYVVRSRRISTRAWRFACRPTTTPWRSSAPRVPRTYLVKEISSFRQRVNHPFGYRPIRC